MDLVVVIAFSLVIFYLAVSVAMAPEKVRDAVESEKRQIAEKDDEDLNLPG